LKVSVNELPGAIGCILIQIHTNISVGNRQDLVDALDTIDKAKCKGMVIDINAVESRETIVFDEILKTAKKLGLTKHEVRFIGLSGDTRITFFNNDYGFELGFSRTIEEACELIKGFGRMKKHDSEIRNMMERQDQGEQSNKNVLEAVEERRKEGF
jgi:anti-anti-sigma regulatory factor